MNRLLETMHDFFSPSTPLHGWRRVLELRRATAGDRGFLWELQRRALRPAVEATWGWEEELQVRLFAERFTTDDLYIVSIDGLDAGAMRYVVRADEVFLANVALLPEHQGRGVGTRLVGRVLEEGSRRSLPVTLQVLKANRARRFYERLGFEACGETDTHVHMRSSIRLPDLNG